MKLRILAATATVFVAAGCGDWTGQGGAVIPQSTEITVDGHTQDAQSVSCTQVNWLLSIEAAVDPGLVRASLRLGGTEPKVPTVAIENVDNFYGVSGEYVNGVDAKATVADGTYTITGTARGTDPKNPSIERTADFRIDVRC